MSVNATSNALHNGLHKKERSASCAGGWLVRSAAGPPNMFCSSGAPLAFAFVLARYSCWLDAKPLKEASAVTPNVNRKPCPPSPKLLELAADRSLLYCLELRHCLLKTNASCRRAPSDVQDAQLSDWCSAWVSLAPTSIHKNPEYPNYVARGFGALPTPSCAPLNSPVGDL